MKYKYEDQDFVTFLSYDYYLSVDLLSVLSQSLGISVNRTNLGNTSYVCCNVCNRAPTNFKKIGGMRNEFETLNKRDQLKGRPHSYVVKNYLQVTTILAIR